MTTATARAATAVLVALVVGGCGGGSSPELSHDQFIARANDLCITAQHKVYDRQSRVLEGDVFPSGFPDERFQRYYTESIAIGRELLDAVRALNSPATEENTVRDGLAAIDSQLDTMQELRDALDSDAEYRDRAGRRFDPRLGRRLEAMAKIGLEPCASVGFGPAAGR